MINKQKNKFWGEIFAVPTDPRIEQITASINYDKRLYEQDIRVSQVHASMLSRQGIISSEDAQLIIIGLNQIKTEIEAGKIEWQNYLEDIHTHIENRLKEIIGSPANRLHTARSRNDQIATDLRLWIIDYSKKLDHALLIYQHALISLADSHIKAIMPGYTHLQRAQPILFAHHLLAYVEMAWRDRERLNDSLKRTNILPLGAAALAGTSYPIDPNFSAKELGFSGICNNSLDAVSDRDFVAELLFILVLIQIHLSRLAEELILWSTQEFNYITLSDSFTTGSSIMPHKKNPDVVELLRGKTGQVIGDLIAILTILKGLPLTYNKDLQEDKKILFNSADLVLECIQILPPLLNSIIVNEERMYQAANEGFLNSTDLADYLVNKKLTFREAYKIAGEAVRIAQKKGINLIDLTLTELQNLSTIIQEDVFDILKIKNIIDRRSSPGGTASQNVKLALKKAKKRLCCNLK